MCVYMRPATEIIYTYYLYTFTFFSIIFIFYFPCVTSHVAYYSLCSSQCQGYATITRASHTETGHIRREEKKIAGLVKLTSDILHLFFFLIQNQHIKV